MTAQNLPSEPEFEQAYKGKSSILCLFNVPLQMPFTRHFVLRVILGFLPI